MVILILRTLDHCASDSDVTRRKLRIDMFPDASPLVILLPIECYHGVSDDITMAKTSM